MFCYTSSSVTLCYIVPILNPAGIPSFFSAQCIVPPSCASRTGLRVIHPYKISVCPSARRSGTGFFHRISSGTPCVLGPAGSLWRVSWSQGCRWWVAASSWHLLSGDGGLGGKSASSSHPSGASHLNPYYGSQLQLILLGGTEFSKFAVSVLSLWEKWVRGGAQQGREHRLKPCREHFQLNLLI